jgi:hypothetical protein
LTSENKASSNITESSKAKVIRSVEADIAETNSVGFETTYKVPISSYTS